MAHNRNALLAITVTVIGMVVIVGWFVVASSMFGGDPTNIASEISKNARVPRTSRVTVNTPIPLIPDVSLALTRIRWTSSFVYRPDTYGQGVIGTSAGSIAPSNPDLRFLVVEYEIANESAELLSRDNLVELLHVTGPDGLSIDAVDSETLRLKERFTYGTSPTDKLLRIPPNLTYEGSWFFELDSRTPRLLLTSPLIGFELTLPADIHNPLNN